MSGAAHAEVQRRDADRRGLVVAADDDAVGMEEVVDGRALAEELGVRHDAHVGPAEHPLDDLGRADGHGRLVDDDGARAASAGAISAAAASM